MIGDHYWAVGILIEMTDDGRWHVWVEFLDDGFCANASTEGELRARYMLPDLDEMVDLIKQDAERLGIVFKAPYAGALPTVYYKGDGYRAGDPPDARQIADRQSARLGWRQVYKETETV